MSKVTIYRFKIYDIRNDEYHRSLRWAALEAIKSVGGVALRDTAAEVDSSVVGPHIPGMTERGFNPHARTGTQRQVTV